MAIEPVVSQVFEHRSSGGQNSMELTARREAAPREPEQEIQTQTVDEDTVLTLEVKLKLASTAFSFFCAGCNDGCIGVLLPYILQSYEIGTGLVAVMYAATFAGWMLAAFTNSYLVMYFGIGAILAAGAALQLLSQALRCWFPPFGLFCTAFFVAALGIAYQDSHSNTFVSTVKGAHRWLGLIHAMYALGCLVSPFIANAVASAQSPSIWYYYYFFPLGLGAVNLGMVLAAFKDSLRLTQEDSVELQTTSRNTMAANEMLQVIKQSSVWLMSLFFFFYLGAGFTAGGWVVEYLVTVRHGDLSKMGYVPTGYNGGTFLGRVLLAEPTHRFGEKRMLVIYSVLCLGLQLVFWLVPNITISATAMSLMGFFFGPFFATGVSVASKIFPRRIRPAALGFVFVMAQAGGAIFPSITGLIATSAGVQVLQPIVTALIVAGAGCWTLLPRVPK